MQTRTKIKIQQVWSLEQAILLLRYMSMVFLMLSIVYPNSTNKFMKRWWYYLYTKPIFQLIVGILTEMTVAKGVQLLNYKFVVVKPLVKSMMSFTGIHTYITHTSLSLINVGEVVILFPPPYKFLLEQRTPHWCHVTSRYQWWVRLPEGRHDVTSASARPQHNTVWHCCCCCTPSY